VVEITVAFYLGIDGGGTKTSCAVGDELEILASATAGPSNITRVGEEHARESMQQAIRAACHAAKISPQEIKRTCIGAAGAARAEVADAVRKFTAEFVSGEIEVAGDMIIALEAAFGSGPGVIVNAGTGSFAYGRDTHGTTARAGGWGFATSDEGSAHWVGLQAVSVLLRAADEGAGLELVANHAERQPLMDAPLLRELQAAWSVNSLQQLVRKANSSRDFAALFPAALAAANAGDRLAQEVLKKAADELARLASIVARHLFPEENSSANSVVSVAMTGGVFRHSQQVLDCFRDRIRAMHAKVALNPEIVEPVYGALRMARRCKS
jgi:glucosamine kinase